MSYVAANPILYNAAVAGFLAGMIDGQFPTDTVATNYNNAVLEAQAWAEAVDQEIGTDSRITSEGITRPPTTGNLQELELGKAFLIYGLSHAASFQHYKGSKAGSPFAVTDFNTAGTAGAALVAGVTALYTQGLTVLLFP